MKRISSVLLILLLGAVPCLGQGTLYFSNYVPELGIMGRGYDGLTGQPMTSDWLAQILFRTDPIGGNLSAVGPAVSFGSGVPDGYFDGGLVTIPGTTPGQVVAVAVGAWVGSSGTAWSDAGFKGYSEITGVRLGGGGSPAGPPGYLFGLSSFVIPFPEPTVASLTVLGVALWGLVRLAAKRRRT